jgi:hypothetical protein
MNRRDASRTLLGIAAGSALLPRSAEAQSCPTTTPSFSQTPAELTAGVTPTCPSYPPGNLLRYGADNTGNATNNNVAAMQAALKLATFIVPATKAPSPAIVYVPAGT